MFQVRLLAGCLVALALAAQEGPIPSQAAAPVPAMGSQSQVPSSPQPGSRAAAILAAIQQAQGQGTTSPQAPSDTPVPSAQEVLNQAQQGTSPESSEATETKSEEQENNRTLHRLRKAYTGPFILASDLFSARTSSSHQTSSAAVSDDYRLGTGDQMMLYVFGSATFEVPLVVDRTGRITIPKVGTAQVAGLRLGDARQVVQRLVNTILGGSRVDLQFSRLRDVRIFVLGEVYLPGSHVVPSLTSLLNALAVGGGPTPFGSYRNIQLIRDGKVVQTLDLYPLRLKGLGMENILLRDGDTVFVPPTGVQILMDGSFVRVATSPQTEGAPGVLVELKAGEKASDAMQYIGGLQPTADPTLLTLQRRDASGIIHVENLPLSTASLQSKALYPGDILRAMARADWTVGQVEITGQVKVPGVFAYTPGMRVADLLMNPMQIQPDTYMGRGQILRTLDDGTTELYAFNVAEALKKDPSQNLVLQPRDKVELYGTEALHLKRTVTVLGPFTKAGTYAWNEHMHASDLIFEAGVPELNADRYYAELAHMGRDGQPGKVVKLDLHKLLYTEHYTAQGAHDPTLDPELQPYDQITLYEIPDFRPHRTITITGQVKHPGSYVITDPHTTLKQMVERAGGLTEDAMPQGTIFLRNALTDRGINYSELLKIRMAEAASEPLMGSVNAGSVGRGKTLSKGQGDAAEPSALGLAGLLQAKTGGGKEGTASMDPTGQGINDILQRLNETKRDKLTSMLLTTPVMHGLLAGTTNRLVVDLAAILKGDARRDVVLLDGDQIIVPRKSDSVYVVGEVASPFATFQVEPGDRVRDIIKLAGGFTRNADEWQVRLLKADGRILDHWVEWQHVDPGDAILVPQRFRMNTTWQDTLQALMPLAIIYNAVHK